MAREHFHGAHPAAVEGTAEGVKVRVQTPGAPQTEPAHVRHVGRVADARRAAVDHTGIRQPLLDQLHREPNFGALGQVFSFVALVEEQTAVEALAAAPFHLGDPELGTRDGVSTAWPEIHERHREKLNDGGRVTESTEPFFLKKEGAPFTYQQLLYHLRYRRSHLMYFMKPNMCICSNQLVEPRPYAAAGHFRSDEGSVSRKHNAGFVLQRFVRLLEIGRGRESERT